MVREGYSGIDYDKTSLDGKDKSDNSILKPKMLAMAVPAFFLLCCMLVCPCFQARKKDTGHTVLSKELNSSKYYHVHCSDVYHCSFQFWPLLSSNGIHKVTEKLLFR